MKKTVDTLEVSPWNFLDTWRSKDCHTRMMLYHYQMSGRSPAKYCNNSEVFSTWYNKYHFAQSFSFLISIECILSDTVKIIAFLYNHTVCLQLTDHYKKVQERLHVISWSHIKIQLHMGISTSFKHILFFQFTIYLSRNT